MIFTVLFKLNHNHKTDITSTYRPDWVSSSKPEHNCGSILIKDNTRIMPGKSAIGNIHPLVPNLWENVKVNDVLICMEGVYAVGEALVLEITN